MLIMCSMTEERLLPPSESCIDGISLLSSMMSELLLVVILMVALLVVEGLSRLASKLSCLLK